MDYRHHRFAERHIGPQTEEVDQMLEDLGCPDLPSLIEAVIPGPLLTPTPPDLPEALDEAQAIQALEALASRNTLLRSFIGMGYHDCIVPPVIQRNVLENPGWYTPYTPYQAEIAQGRLEALLHFQTMICDLTAMEVANASLLDEATAAAEAMHLCLGVRSRLSQSKLVAIDHCHPQTLAVLSTRAAPLGITLEHQRLKRLAMDDQTFAVLLQFPATDGAVYDLKEVIDQVHAAGALAIVSTDLLCLTLLKAPGECGADVVVGSAQRLGVPLGFGGPHAAFLATRDRYKRKAPGRIVGVSHDSRGRPAFRLALQTREQHIRREKATSNLCTAQALLANMAVFYAIYHGPEGLRDIAARIHHFAKLLAAGLEAFGHRIMSAAYFDTLHVKLKDLPSGKVIAAAKSKGINLRTLSESEIGIALDETVTQEDLGALLSVFGEAPSRGREWEALERGGEADVLERFRRHSPFLQESVFRRYHSETEMTRFLHRLASRDLSLTHSMIPLGSCTMKLNAAVELFPLTWPRFARLHPFAPKDQAAGYHELFRQLETWLAAITGFDAVSLQPNAGSQGEYTGLLVIRKYHASHCESQRDVCLIPRSAHGTNPASAVMAGLKVVPVECDGVGNIDRDDLRAKCEAHATRLAALMVTYPSTHGVFETGIQHVCQLVHQAGGQVYLDGANMNAMVGLCRPGDFGADLCHLNLHKTFCIPHGGGGPGVGPIAVAGHLTRFLPNHPLEEPRERPDSVGTVAAAPYGSASLLTISWVFLRCMGASGLKTATQIAILNANYIARRLAPYFPIVYQGNGGWIAHECIIDLRRFKKISVEDVAKRLMDYGFHAPTVSWPVAGTMMIEPTESESKEELDRFCEALIHIHHEIMEVEDGRGDPENNPLKNAPHTADQIADDSWDRPYSRRQAAFPLPWLRDRKFWPFTSRIDNVYGDRHPVCTCDGMDDL